MASLANYASEDIADLARMSKRFGFSGATCVNPGAIEELNKGSRPTDEEVADAERLIATMVAANEKGQGAASLDGRMIDAPLLRRASNTLRLARRSL